MNKTIICLMLAVVFAGSTVHAANGPEIALSGPYDTDNTNEVLFVAATIQLSNNVLKIEQSVNNLFNFSVSATWSCYPYEQHVAGFFIVPRNSDDRFYRAVNTPCAGNFVPAGAMEVAGPIATPIRNIKLARWHTPEGYRLAAELPQTDPKVRRFILMKIPLTSVMPPWPGTKLQPPKLPDGAAFRKERLKKRALESARLKSPKNS